MILIPNFDVNQLNTSQLSPLEMMILQQKMNAPAAYHYNSPEALLFELRMRTEIVFAARALASSNATFATFENARCNERLWILEEDGGFRLRPGVSPSDGIRDIYQNGYLYAFECATAMLIILYMAALNAIGEQVFNVYFSGLYLRDWNYDYDLRLVSNNQVAAYPGDVLYFKNPEHNPRTPEWQGENAVLLDDQLYFGHGLGIRTADSIIASLNRKRIPGSQVSAYLTDQVVHPDFEYVRRLSLRDPQAVIARIGSHTWRG